VTDRERRREQEEAVDAARQVATQTAQQVASQVPFRPRTFVVCLLVGSLFVSWPSLLFAARCFLGARVWLCACDRDDDDDDDMAGSERGSKANSAAARG
jgi:hypothetical protein